MAIIDGQKELQVFAQTFVEGLVPKKDSALVVGLSGELGSGKTAFVQCVARLLGVKEGITSPTFVIQKSYPLQGQSFDQLVHIDAYRLENAHELEVLGWKELALDPKNLIFIEWPERVMDVLPKDIITLSFEYVDEVKRNITIHDSKEN